MGWRGAPGPGEQAGAGPSHWPPNSGLDRRFGGDRGRGSLPAAVLEAGTQSLQPATSVIFHSLCTLAGREGRKGSAFPGRGKVAASVSPAGQAAGSRGGCEERRREEKARPGPRRHGDGAGLQPWRRRRGTARVRPGPGPGPPAPRSAREGWRRGRAAAGRRPSGAALPRPPASRLRRARRRLAGSARHGAGAREAQGRARGDTGVHMYARVCVHVCICI